MSLGIAFKGPEGIVLTADSRVTLHAFRDVGGQQFVIPATFDYATKLLTVEDGEKPTYVAAVTYGLSATSRLRCSSCRLAP